MTSARSRVVLHEAIRDIPMIGHYKPIYFISFSITQSHATVGVRVPHPFLMPDMTDLDPVLAACGFGELDPWGLRVRRGMSDFTRDLYDSILNSFADLQKESYRHVRL
jgi:hypothetical protein